MDHNFTELKPNSGELDPTQPQLVLDYSLYKKVQPSAHARLVSVTKYTTSYGGVGPSSAPAGWGLKVIERIINVSYTTN